MTKFLEHISKYKTKPAFVKGDETVSYSQFISQVESYIHLLTAQLDTNTKVVIAVKAEPSYIYYAKLLAIDACKQIALPYVNLEDISSIQYEVVFDTELVFLNTNETQYKLPGSGIILLSSGITGKPKAILHMLDLLTEKYIKLNTSFKSILVFSPEHISGIETVLSIIAPGGTIYFPENRDALTIAENIGKNQVNLLACTPTFLKLIYLTHAFELYDLSSLQVINYGAERMDKQLLKTLQQKLPNTQFYQAFGTTETTNIRTYTLADTDYFKPGVEGQDYIIKYGQLFLKLSQSFVTDLSNQMDIEGEWYATGDLVETNELGYIRITARKNEIINVGGEKVSPHEVEHVILEIPGVVDVKVFSEHNLIMGQIVKATIVVEESYKETISKKYIIDFFKLHIADYKIPQKIEFAEKLVFNNRMKRT